MHPQPMLSLPIEGASMPFIIGAIGAWYSAVPIACNNSPASRPNSRPAAAAPAIAPQLPDE